MTKLIIVQMTGHFLHIKRVCQAFTSHLSTSTFKMAPIAKKYDYLVLGAGSGGIASVRRAAEFGVSCAVIEKGALGGTCVSCCHSIMYILCTTCYV